MAHLSMHYIPKATHCWARGRCSTEVPSSGEEEARETPSEISTYLQTTSMSHLPEESHNKGDLGLGITFPRWQEVFHYVKISIISSA